MGQRGRATRMAPAERRAAIVEATLPLVLREGPNVSTRAIAEAAGVAEGTLFRVFPDKDALMRAVLAEAFDPMSSLAELAAVDRSLDLRARLVAAVDIVQRRLVGIFRVIDAIGLTQPPPMGEPGSGDYPEPHHQRPRAMNEQFMAAIVDVVGPDRDRLRVPAEELAHVLRLFTFSATHPRLAEGRVLDAAEVVGVLLDGLLAPAPPACPAPTTAHYRTGD